MISDKMQEALNLQINEEFRSAFTYLALSAYFESEELRGCAIWMRVQYEEELMHGAKIYDYIHDRDGQVSLSAVAAPPRATPTWTPASAGTSRAWCTERRRAASRRCWRKIRSRSVQSRVMSRSRWRFVRRAVFIVSGPILAEPGVG